MSETKRNNAIHLGAPGEDISKKDLHTITQRFKNLNQLRLNRVQDLVQKRQQIFLQLLPLLFHQNQALFPGFISSETPAGIPDYAPNKQTKQAAKQFSKGFTYKRRALLNYPIQGIFLMGSVSSIAFSKNSDMDIWLCHQSTLTATELKELQQKATEIEKWAASFNLEAHFFLINSELFSKGENIPISEESSGDTQHYLLLEEFYRTAIFIAGQIPAWWLVPPHQEYNYSNYIAHLIENRFISKNEIIDFGGLESIPAEEFISATLWHIYKSLNSPHKSLLKLFLMESYASEYPKPKWLCFDLKTAIYQGNINIDQLDPYLLIYKKVEDYLQQQESLTRLNLARQCFYLKIIGSSEKGLDYNSRVFREDYMNSIAEQWNWPEDLIPTIARQRSWNIQQATQQHLIIRNELKQCLRIVLNLANDFINYNYRNNEDVKLLGRKLHVFLERKVGKIEIITTRSAVRTQESELSIIESLTSNGLTTWSLYSGKFNPEKTSNPLIKQEQSLLAILAWLVINGLYKKQLAIHFKSSSLKLSKNEISQTLDKLSLFLSNKLKNHSSPLSIYKKPDKLISSLICINLGIALTSEREDGMLVLSDRSDPLSYGKERFCFIQQIDQISVSSWGEVTTSQHLGIDGFLNCISNIFNQSQHPKSINHLKTLCFVPSRANSITLRIESIFNKLVEIFANQNADRNSRYFLAGEQLSYIFQQKNQRLQYWAIDSTEQILQELANPQGFFSNVYFDPDVLDNLMVAFLYSFNIIDTIQVFYFSENKVISIFIIDENGALFTQEHHQSSFNQVLTNYAHFLESVLIHSLHHRETQLKFYEINRDSTGEFSSQETKWKATHSAMDLSIRINIDEMQSLSQTANYTVYCNDVEFNTLTHGNQLFTKISEYILKFRKNAGKYPIHISDIDIPCSYLGADNEDQLQTIHFLNYKKKIEAKLNIL